MMSKHTPVESHMNGKSASSPDTLLKASRKSGIALSEQQLKGVSGGLTPALECANGKHF